MNKITRRYNKTLKESLISSGIPKIIVKLYKIRQYKKIVLQIDLKNPKKILDVGGGDGTLSNSIKNKLKNANFTILDLNKIKIKKDPHIKFIQENAEKMPFKINEFDLVICKDVLHHCKNPEKAVKEIKRVGKKWIIIEARRGDKWLDHFLEEHNHFTESEFKKLIKPEQFYYLDILWPSLKVMVFLLFMPVIPKSKKAFMVGTS